MRFPSEFTTKQTLQEEDLLLVADSDNSNAPVKSPLSKIWSYIQSKIETAEGLTLKNPAVTGNMNVSGNIEAAGGNIGGELTVEDLTMEVNGAERSIAALLGTLMPIVITAADIMNYIESTGDNETTFADLTDNEKLNIALRLAGSYQIKGDHVMPSWHFPDVEMRVIKCAFQHRESNMKQDTYLYIRKKSEDTQRAINTCETLLSPEGVWWRWIGGLVASATDWQWKNIVWSTDVTQYVSNVVTPQLARKADAAIDVYFFANNGESDENTLFHVKRNVIESIVVAQRNNMSQLLEKITARLSQGLYDDEYEYFNTTNFDLFSKKYLFVGELDSIIDGDSDFWNEYSESGLLDYFGGNGTYNLRQIDIHLFDNDTNEGDNTFVMQIPAYHFADHKERVYMKNEDEDNDRWIDKSDYGLLEPASYIRREISGRIGAYIGTLTIYPEQKNIHIMTLEQTVLTANSLALATPNGKQTASYYLLLDLTNLIEKGTLNIDMPANIVWANKDIPNLAFGKTYEISILNNLACYAEY